MSELQTEEVQATVQGESGTAESGAELATATGEVQEQTTEVDPQAEANSKAQAAINKQHARFKGEERKRIAVEAEAAKLREQLEAIEAAKVPTEVPPIPDQYDDDYEAKVQARDQILLQKAKAESRTQFDTERQQAAQNEAQQATQRAILEKVESFNSRAGEAGMTVEELTTAGNVVVNNGAAPEVCAFLLDDPDGPIITKYLAANPLELDSLRGLTPMQAGLKIDRTIRQSASTLKPKASEAPDPPEVLSGKGAPEGTNPWLKGVIYS